MKKPKVALLCGGNSPEREVSLKGGQAVAEALRRRGYPVEVFDPPGDLPLLAQRVREFDLAFPVLHGPGGEDGTIQGFLEALGLPYLGAGVLGSALAMDKFLSKLLYREVGLKVPDFVLVRKGERPSPLKIPFPVVVKPVSQGSSVGISLVEDEEGLREALSLAFRYEERVLVEEKLSGRELTVGILGETPLPVVEIRPWACHRFFDYQAKYTPGATEELCPAPIPDEIASAAKKAAFLAHQALNLRHVSRTDFILTETGDLYVLETNTLPGLTETSLLPLAARTAGLSFEDLVEKMVALVLATGVA